MNASRQIALVVTLPVALISAGVFTTAKVQRDAALLGAKRQVAAQELLTAMLDQETGARGYFQTRQAVFLEPWNSGTRRLERSFTDLRPLVTGDEELTRMLETEKRRTAAWHAKTEADIVTRQRGGPSQTPLEALEAKAIFDQFRADHSTLDQALSSRRSRALTTATAVSVSLVASLALVLVWLGFRFSRHVARQQRRRQLDQSELRELLQASESEQESRRLLLRHIEKVVPSTRALVFNRNNSDDRLEITHVEGAGEGLLADVDPARLRPRSCMAVRLSRSYRRDAGDKQLAPCEVCGGLPGTTACEPLLVGGQVIGSVLVTARGPIGREDMNRMRESVSQAAPILANQRNLMLAEARATSDALTGLPNRRAADDTLKRMIAHAGRTVSPLAAILLDLDHFKRLNDQHGHETGDKALALVGRIISSAVRGSDFAARFGGEEFLVLLPDTDEEGAVVVAEKIRTEIGRAEVPGAGTITASLGAAVLPTHATTDEELLRKADRALYTAKQDGRNRVHVFTPEAEPVIGA